MVRDLLPAAIRTDAAQRAGVLPGEVELLHRELVTWRDGSLGCPEADRLYTQALVPGYRYRVRAGHAIHSYHADRRGHWLWCPPGRGTEPLQASDS